MTTVVRPICIENHQFCAIWVAALFVEILNYTTQVVGIHCQTILFAEWHKVSLLHIAEAFQHFNWFDFSILIDTKHRHIFFATLYGIDCVFADTSKSSFIQLFVKQQKTSATNTHLSRRVNQFHTIHSTCCALIELTWQTFDCNI